MKIKKYCAYALIASLSLTLTGCDSSSKKDKADKETKKTVVQKDEEVEIARNQGVDLKEGDVAVDVNFDDDKTDGFTTYINGGKAKLLGEDGKLVVDITSCGSKDYANQAYWDGFFLCKGAVYTYSFDISSDIDRQVEYRLQMNGGDYHAYKGEKIKVGKDVTHFETEFTMEEDSDPAPRLVFNMGLMEDMKEDPGAHKIYIDNVKLVVKDASNAQVMEGLPIYNKVAINEVGYLPNDKKTVFVQSKTDTKFEVIDRETNKSIYEDKLPEAVFDPATDEWIQLGDFSQLTTPGSYIVKSESGESYPFEITDGIYDNLYKDTVLMLYSQRCGMDVNVESVPEFSHKACHMDKATVYESDETKDVTGGWHDAGDYGRYVVAGAKTVADLFLTYEDCNADSDELGIPESKNGIPDILDEAKYELDFFFKMQDEKTGGVYHKVTCANFPETVMPTEEKDPLILAPISDAATGAFAAVMAKASVIYKEYDEAYAAKCLEAAKKAWDYLKDKDKYSGFYNPKDIVTGEYRDGIAEDEVYWAAVELNIAADMKIDLSKYLTDRVSVNLGWADIGGYAMYDLIEADIKGSDVAKEKFFTQIDLLKDKASKDMYNITLDGKYPWGSNMSVANAGMLFRMAARITGDKEYDVLAKEQLDYLLGANVMSYSFVTGYGELSPKHPHHRPSQVAGKTIPGMLVGGPNDAKEDPYAKAVLYTEQEARCYADSDQSFSTNEITVYWNSPLIYLLASSMK
ncbi:MAG TPA: glycosyl hydrolase family 9 [Eubacterium sp.]|nr:glycosyl hydrolase family 9 [Eubacterium sp.]